MGILDEWWTSLKFHRFYIDAILTTLGGGISCFAFRVFGRRLECGYVTFYSWCRYTLMVLISRTVRNRRCRVHLATPQSLPIDMISSVDTSRGPFFDANPRSTLSFQFFRGSADACIVNLQSCNYCLCHHVFQTPLSTLLTKFWEKFNFCTV